MEQLKDNWEKEEIKRLEKELEEIEKKRTEIIEKIKACKLFLNF